VSRGARHGHIGFLCEALRGTPTLRKQIEKLKTARIRQRLANAGELLKTAEP
jgi:hypothetical protein